MERETVVFLENHQYDDYEPTKYAIKYSRNQLGSCCGMQIICDISIVAWRYSEDYGDEEWISLNFTPEANSVKKQAFEYLENHLFQPTKYKFMERRITSWERKDLPKAEQSRLHIFDAGILVAADVVRFKGKNISGYYTREFCETTDWTTDGLAVKNPNSSNHVQLWTKIITPRVKVNPHYEVTEVVEVTNETFKRS